MRCEDGQWSGHCLLSATIYIHVYEKKVDIKVEKFSLILWNKNFHNLILANLFLDSRAMNMNQFLIWTHDCLSWSLAGILLIHDGVLLYWIVSVPLYYPPLPPALPLCSQQLYNHFIVRRAGCLAFSNNIIYPTRVKISISLQCSNLCTWVTTWELLLLYGRK